MKKSLPLIVADIDRGFVGRYQRVIRVGQRKIRDVPGERELPGNFFQRQFRVALLLFQHRVIQRLERQIIGILLLFWPHLTDERGQHPGAARRDFTTHTGRVFQTLHEGSAVPHPLFTVDAVGDAAPFGEKGDHAIGIAGCIGGDRLWFSERGIFHHPHCVPVVICGAPAQGLDE